VSAKLRPATVKLGASVRITGRAEGLGSRVRVVLEQGSRGVWRRTGVAAISIGAKASFSLRFRPTHVGLVRMRVRASAGGKSAASRSLRLTVTRSGSAPAPLAALRPPAPTSLPTPVGSPPEHPAPGPRDRPLSAAGTTVVYALGDGADGSATSRALAAYITAQNPDRFFYLGDVYGSGSATDFANNYDAAYGAMAARTDPVMGNHEWANRATGYYPYWASKRGWTEEEARHRSYVDAASGWQVIAYNSEETMTTEGRMDRRPGRQASRHVPGRDGPQGPPYRGRLAAQRQP
jgi:hypothetical protein